jgi:hypothetical protein
MVLVAAVLLGVFPVCMVSGRAIQPHEFDDDAGSPGGCFSERRIPSGAVDSGASAATNKRIAEHCRSPDAGE